MAFDLNTHDEASIREYMRRHDEAAALPFFKEDESTWTCRDCGHTVTVNHNDRARHIIHEVPLSLTTSIGDPSGPLPRIMHEMEYVEGRYGGPNPVAWTTHETHKIRELLRLLDEARRQAIKLAAELRGQRRARG